MKKNKLFAHLFFTAFFFTSCLTTQVPKQEVQRTEEHQPKNEEIEITKKDESLPAEQAETVESIHEPEIPQTENAHFVESYTEPPNVQKKEPLFAEPKIAQKLPDVLIPVLPAPVPEKKNEPEKTLEKSNPITPTIPTVMQIKTAEKPIEKQTELPSETQITGGIWVNEPSYPYISANSNPIPKTQIKPSRSISMPLSGFLDIQYPGTGWIYLGEVDNLNILSFSDRKLFDTDTLFTLRSINSGKTLLHFYKQDILNNEFIDDYLEVSVSNETAKGIEHINTPFYAEIIPQNQIKTQPKPPETTQQKTQTASQKQETTQQKAQAEPNVQQSVPSVPTRQQTVVQTSESAPATTTQTASTQPQTTQTAAPQAAQKNPEPAKTVDTASLSADELLKQAQDALKANDAAKSLSFLEAFFDKAVKDLDKGLFLQGQAYEAKTSNQNIKAAIETYQTLMKQYPSSPLWKQANERVTYLNRFYFNIR